VQTIGCSTNALTPAKTDYKYTLPCYSNTIFGAVAKIFDVTKQARIYPVNLVKTNIQLNYNFKDTGRTAQ
jgi:hypothetical protein